MCLCDCGSVGSGRRFEERGEAAAEREARLKYADDRGGDPAGVVDADPHAKRGLV